MSETTVAHDGYEIATGRSHFGTQTIRALDTTPARQPIAAAIKSTEGWILFAYRGAGTNLPDGVLPKAALTARTPEDARQWLNFIAALHVLSATNLAGVA